MPSVFIVGYCLMFIQIIPTIFFFFASGGVFKLYLQFGEYYNGQPPRVFFHTIPFHPNGEVLLTVCIYVK